MKKEHNWESHHRFNTDDPGDKKLRYTFPLNENSIVFDCGSYLGDWAVQIYNKYRCNVYCFEPVPSYCAALVEKFKFSPKVKVFPYGIGGTNKTVFMSLEGDGDSSTYKESGTEVEIKSIVNVLEELRLDNVDLIKINIETEEFPLMETMIDKNIQHSFDYILCQFHEWADNAEKRHEFIKTSIEKSHDVVFDYNFIWECWKRKQTIPGFGSTGWVEASEK